ncbi:hypothetical protein ESCO_004460 [Escovopsis weberi]|uniref:Chromo domain-containing protein n=1 Tax=Escovopsis weberi TaxID=150374 RepID=A0A0M9VV79_ESCWE|nr:hypothetical protein ESCO_004460 [Escovopsis weberi]
MDLDRLHLDGLVVSKPMVAKPMIRRTRFCIPLPSRYVPGSGPPLPPLRLVPPHDSTAYIKDRLLIPSTGLAANGRALPKRMMYLVGWRDLPAATALVPAMKVLEYVSPYALEEWEARFEQEIDDEQARLEVAKQEEDAALAAAAAAAAAAATTAVAATPTATEALIQVAKRKRGRPPAHSKIEAAVVAEPETVAKAKSQPKRGSMMAMVSPQKKRLREFEGLGFGDDEDELAGDYAFEDLDQVEGEGEDGEEFYDAPPTDKLTGKPTLKYDIISSNRRKDRAYAPSCGRANRRNPSSEVSRHTSSSANKRPASEETATTPAPSAKRRPRSKDPEYFVECLEDVRFHGDPNEGIVRYFKVRWEGDWPPDQKTTWEPEANIPVAMVKTFMKTWRQPHKRADGAGNKDKDRDRKDQKKNKKDFHMQQTTLAWPSERRYSSVTEAFAGDEDSTPEQRDSSQAEGERDPDEIFVVSEEEGGPRAWAFRGT